MAMKESPQNSAKDNAFQSAGNKPLEASAPSPEDTFSRQIDLALSLAGSRKPKELELSTLNELAAEQKIPSGRITEIWKEKNFGRVTPENADRRLRKALAVSAVLLFLCSLWGTYYWWPRIIPEVAVNSDLPGSVKVKVDGTDVGFTPCMLREIVRTNSEIILEHKNPDHKNAVRIITPQRASALYITWDKSDGVPQVDAKP